MGMGSRQLDTPEGSLGYDKDTAGGILISDYSGTDTEVIIPEQIEDWLVKKLKKKVFLSRKRLRKVVLPSSIEEIGDWAFAYCANLESVWIPKKEIKLGSHIFMECNKLQKIYTYENIPEIPGEGKPTEREEQTAALLAAGSVMLQAEYLMNITEAGTEAWLGKWDARMNTIMDAEDGDGYTKMILCGEEDYGSSLEEFIKSKRKAKARLAFLRLMNPLLLQEKTKEKLKAYLLTHTKGSESEEAWEVLLSEHGHEQAYFELFAEIGCINEENFDAALKDMPDECAEMKAFLIRYKEEKMGDKDFFAGLSLDEL